MFPSQTDNKSERERNERFKFDVQTEILNFTDHLNLIDRIYTYIF
jgi:predicted amidophosphoribosyltransferase